MKFPNSSCTCMFFFFRETDALAAMVEDVYSDIEGEWKWGLTLKAYFLLMWSSTDSMEIWKLGRRMLPSIPSSFSSAERQEISKIMYQELFLFANYRRTNCVVNEIKKA